MSLWRIMDLYVYMHLFYGNATIFRSMRMNQATNLMSTWKISITMLKQ